jgi:hypothetical protein
MEIAPPAADVDTPGQCKFTKLLLEIVAGLPQNPKMKVQFSQFRRHENQIELATGRGKFLQVRGTISPLRSWKEKHIKVHLRLMN